MTVDTKYGRIAIDGIPEDEPVFVLRAKDKASVETIKDYRLNARAEGSTDSFCHSVDQVVRDFERWQRTNPAKVRAAD